MPPPPREEEEEEDGKEARETLAALDDGALALPTREDCARFLAALQAVTYAGVCDSLYLRDSAVGEERSVASATEAVHLGLCGAAGASPGEAPRA